MKRASGSGWRRRSDGDEPTKRNGLKIFAARRILERGGVRICMDEHVCHMMVVRFSNSQLNFCGKLWAAIQVTVEQGLDGVTGDDCACSPTSLRAVAIFHFCQLEQLAFCRSFDLRRPSQLDSLFLLRVGARASERSRTSIRSPIRSTARSALFKVSLNLSRRTVVVSDCKGRFLPLHAGEKIKEKKSVILLKGHIARNDTSRNKIASYVKVEFPKLYRKEHKKDIRVWLCMVWPY